MNATHGRSASLTARSVVTWVAVAIGLAVLAACTSAEERAQSHYENGVKLVAQGEPAKAALEFRNALKFNANLVPALVALADVQEKQGDLNGALRLYVNATERDTSNLIARVHASRILLAGGQLDSALKFADEAYALAPSDSEVLATKAGVALKLEDYSGAVDLAKKALAAAPENLDAMLILAAERAAHNDLTGALTYLDQANQKYERSLPLQLFRLRVLDGLHDDDRVEQVFTKLTEFYPNDANFRDGLARWYMSHDRKDDAERVLRKYAANNPDDIQAELTVVDFLRRERGLEAAREELAARVAAGGNTFPFKLSLAQLKFATDDRAGAIADITGLIGDTHDATQLATAKIQLARMLMSENDTSGAAKWVDEVLKNDARNVEALTLRAALRVGEGNYSSALDDLRAAASEAPQSAQVMMLLADTYERNGDVELAGEQYAKAIRADASNADYALRYSQFLLRYGKVDQAERVLIGARTNAPANKQVLTQLAQIKLNKQDWEGAQEVADALGRLGDKPSQDAADQVKAIALGAQGRYDESISLLQSAATGSPDDVAPMASLVRAYIQAGKKDAAESFVRSVLMSDPDNVLARVLLGTIQTLNGKLSDAEASFNTAITADPKSPLGYAALSRLYLSSQRLDDAERIQRAALNAVGPDPSLQFLLATTLELSGQYDAAIDLYETMLKADPQSTIVANNLASLLSDHRTDAASLDRAFEIAGRFSNSEIPQFVDTLGWIYYLRGDYGAALTLLKLAAERLPNAAPVQYHVGMAYRELGQRALALASLEKALEAPTGQPFPQRQQAQAALDELNRSAAPSAAD